MEEIINAIIIDDDSDFIKLLERQIARAELPLSIVASVTNATDGYAAIRKYKPDVVFLDVEMPGKSGLDLANDFSDRTFEIIFTTSHDQYAMQAIKSAAFDYLMKPVNVAELGKAVDKIIKNKKEKRFNAPAATSPEGQKLIIQSHQGIFFIEIGTIVRCEADNVYTSIYTSDKKKTVSSKTIKEYEERLKPYGFVRVHKTHLINANHIKKYHRGESSYLQMSDESTVPVSKSGRDELNQFLNLSA